MKTIIYKADSRGYANHGWLEARHSFSFANYFDRERMNFGVLRVLNDDTVAPGKGFGRHPHDNMEIISIPLYGDLEHKDSMGNVTVIREGDVQVMSAGTGIYHSEYNKNPDKEVKFLQIWVIPNKQNVEPRYDQLTIRDILRENEFCQILSPDKEDQGVWIYQDAWFQYGKFDAGLSPRYKLNNKHNGVYAFVLEGEVGIQGQELKHRDALGLWEVDEIELNAVRDSRILLMELPMK